MGYAMTKEKAEEFAASLNARFVGQLVTHDGGAPDGRRYTRFAVDRYPDGDKPRALWPFGVVPKWEYVDRPDIGELGGGFAWLNEPGETPVPDGFDY